MMTMFVGLRWNEASDSWQLVFAKDSEAGARERLRHWQEKDVGDIYIFKAEELPAFKSEELPGTVSAIEAGG